MDENSRSEEKLKSGRPWIFPMIAALSLVAISVVSGYLWWLNLPAKAPSQSANELKLKAKKQYNRKKYDQAVESLEKYLALKPRDWRAHELLSDLYWRDGDGQNAYKELRRAHEINGPQADRLYRLGLLATIVGKDRRAIDYLMKSVDLRPKSMLFRVELAKAYVKRKKYEKAILEWNRTIENLPENDIYSAVIYAELGDTFQLLGDGEKAKGAYLQGLGVEPNNLYLKDQVAKLGG